MFLSYLVTCHNETDSLNKLLGKIQKFISKNDECIILDDFSNEKSTLEILENYSKIENFFIHKHLLNNDYGAHKNYGISICKKSFIFQLDADECPTDLFLENINEILESNSDNEAIWIPRLNIFKGVTQEDIRMWGWKYDGKYINFPDYQSRLFRNLPHIRYQRRLHEKVEGFKSYTFIPPQKDYAIVHEKTIEKQRQTNINYNKLFTEEENKGYSVK
jgi:glycosyltransferase involved in cell wall biosynthesis